MSSQLPVSEADQCKGTCLVVTAACIFALVALIVNEDPLPLLLATECRYMVCWVAAACLLLAHNSCLKCRGGETAPLEWFGPNTDVRPWLFLKSLLSFLFSVLWWAGLRQAPIGDSIALIYCSPALTSVFSWAVLGERFPRGFVLQLLLTLSGVALVVHPPFIFGGESKAHSDYTFTFMALFLAGFIPVATTKTRGISWIQVEHTCAFTAALVANPVLMLLGRLFFAEEGSVLPGVKQLPAATEVVFIGLAALGAFVGLACETRGYQLADPGRASMIRYVEVPFAYVLQHFFCGDKQPVQARAIMGSALIFASCAVALLEERAARRALEKLPAARQKLLDAEKQ